MNIINIRKCIIDCEFKLRVFIFRIWLVIRGIRVKFWLYEVCKWFIRVVLVLVYINVVILGNKGNFLMGMDL